MNERWGSLLVLCSLLVLLLLTTTLFYYGVQIASILLTALALVCPVLIGWLYYRFVREARAPSSPPVHRADVRAEEKDS